MSNSLFHLWWSAHALVSCRLYCTPLDSSHQGFRPCQVVSPQKAALQHLTASQALKKPRQKPSEVKCHHLNFWREKYSRSAGGEHNQLSAQHALPGSSVFDILTTEWQFTCLKHIQYWVLLHLWVLGTPNKVQVFHIGESGKQGHFWKVGPKLLSVMQKW